MLDLIENPENRLSHEVGHMIRFHKSYLYFAFNITFEPAREIMTHTFFHILQQSAQVSLGFSKYRSFIFLQSTFEPRREKTGLLHMRKQRRRCFTVTAKLIIAFVFAIRIVQFLCYLNPKFQASSYLL